MTHKRVASFLWLTLRKNAFVTFQKIDLNEMVRDGLHCRLTSSVTSAPEKAGARSHESETLGSLSQRNLCGPLLAPSHAVGLTAPCRESAAITRDGGGVLRRAPVVRALAG